jgi:hypothetical protein
MLCAQVWCCGACVRGPRLSPAIHADASVRWFAGPGPSAHAASTTCASAVTVQVKTVTVQAYSSNCLSCQNRQRATGTHQKNWTPSRQGHRPRTQILFPLPVADCSWFIAPSERGAPPSRFTATATHWTSSSLKAQETRRRMIAFVFTLLWRVLNADNSTILPSHRYKQVRSWCG